MIELDRSVPFVGAVMAGDLDAAVELLAAAEREASVQVTGLEVDYGQEHRDEEWIEQQALCFLRETQLVISGDELLSPFDLVDIDARPLPMSWRQWGGIVAEWANEDWHARPDGRSWSYIDFYMDSYLAPKIRHYEDWARKVQRVIEMKDRLHGLHLTRQGGGA